MGRRALGGFSNDEDGGWYKAPCEARGDEGLRAVTTGGEAEVRGAVRSRASRGAIREALKVIRSGLGDVDGRRLVSCSTRRGVEL